MKPPHTEQMDGRPGSLLLLFDLASFSVGQDLNKSRCHLNSYLANSIDRNERDEISSSMKSQAVLDIAFCPLAHFMTKVTTVLRP